MLAMSVMASREVSLGGVGGGDKPWMWANPTVIWTEWKGRVRESGKHSLDALCCLTLGTMLFQVPIISARSHPRHPDGQTLKL